MNKQDVLAQDFRAILSEQFGVDYDSEEYTKVSEGGCDVDIIIEPSTGKITLVEQSRGRIYEQNNHDCICIAENKSIQFEEDLEKIAEDYFDRLEEQQA